MKCESKPKFRSRRISGRQITQSHKPDVVPGQHRDQLFDKVLVGERGLLSRLPLGLCWAEVDGKAAELLVPDNHVSLLEVVELGLDAGPASGQERHVPVVVAAELGHQGEQRAVLLLGPPFLVGVLVLYHDVHATLHRLSR